MANKDNKTIWIVALVVIVAVVFIFGNFRGLTGKQVIQSPPQLLQPQPLVRVHSCDADSVCEVNNLRIAADDGMSILTISPDRLRVYSEDYGNSIIEISAEEITLRGQEILGE